MDNKVYNCLTLYQLDNTSEYTIYNIIHFSASIHGHGNTDILPTYSPVPARHDHWWRRPLTRFRRLSGYADNTKKRVAPGCRQVPVTEFWSRCRIVPSKHRRSGLGTGLAGFCRQSIGIFGRANGLAGFCRQPGGSKSLK